MDHLVYQLRKGQRKLGWALEKHMQQAEVDQTMFTNAIHFQGDNQIKMAEGQTEMVADIGLSRGPMVSGAMVPLQKYVPEEEPAHASSWPTERWSFF
ncbi:hypothetical protein NDU88_006064 [Pleurodeles waltl]|uniref:Uncharacterized protein n=1 Tax=Pleurodeles waltl TaxID=8319 RepID=A0AAV7MCU2_PLEWA|nr:hypothetical protein NDU88_006064 [Pleurodeles waltl]